LALEWRPAPAVGEKKRDDDGVGLGGVPFGFAEKGRGGLECGGGAAERRSRDMVEEAPTAA